MLSLLNFSRKFVKAEGMYVWDDKGGRYLDFLGGYGSLNLGHNHPDIWKAIEKIKSSPILLQAALNPIASALAENLSKVTPGDLKVSFFCNSGAEAVEGALKIARIASKKKKFLYTINSFHGKTFGALSVTGREKYQKAFKPLLPGCVDVPFGDIDLLEKRLSSKKFAAFILEPVQGEGGIVVPEEGYLSKVRGLCSKYKTYLILDEIQTGLGRTGKMFACEYEDVVPDILTLAKSLGGGIAPIGVYITTNEIWSKAYGSLSKALLHTSTFGGNTFSSVCALETLRIIIEDNLVEKSYENGEYFLSKLRGLQKKHKMIKSVRGKGLLIGVEFLEPKSGLMNKLSLGLLNKLSKEYLASFIASELLNSYKIITAYTLNNPNVVRFEPPLYVSKEEIDLAVKALDEICSKYKGLSDFGIKAGKDFLKKISS
ncbi:MAG: aspartate aminotransferase family protein [Actinomycetia bacterium]|nr:aspartate aminotransferase family protein [Actinomycetes bacterium]